MSAIRDVDLVLRSLEARFARIRYYMDEQQKLGSWGLGPARTDEEQQLLSDLERQVRERCRNELEGLLDFPPRHLRHQPHLDAFWEAGSYERSVFVMTKFPEHPAAAAKDAELTRVLDAVCAAVRDAGFTPRIASDRDYHDQLWDNVELHMLGCKHGIAIVEDRYLPELNPNVAMEWGWMRGMSKRVLYLVEQTFTRQRADFVGLLSKPFSWEDPEPGVSAAVTAFLDGS